MCKKKHPKEFIWHKPVPAFCHCESKHVVKQLMLAHELPKETTFFEVKQFANLHLFARFGEVMQVILSEKPARFSGPIV